MTTAVNPTCPNDGRPCDLVGEYKCLWCGRRRLMRTKAVVGTITRIRDTYKPEKAILQLRKPSAHGTVHVELFKYKNGWMIHRHTLTKNAKFAALHPVKRHILGWWYCTQEIMLLDDEIGCIAGLILTIDPKRLSGMLGQFESLLNQNKNENKTV